MQAAARDGFAEHRVRVVSGQLHGPHQAHQAAVAGFVDQTRGDVGGKQPGEGVGGAVAGVLAGQQVPLGADPGQRAGLVRAGAAGDLGGGVAVDGAGEDVGQHRHRCAVDPLGVVVVGGVLADHVEGVGVGAAGARHVHPGPGGALVDQAVAGVDRLALRPVGGDRVGQRRVLLDVGGGQMGQDPVAVADGQRAGQPVAADHLVHLAVGDRTGAVDPQGVVVAPGLDQVSDGDEVAVAGLGEHLGRDPPGG